MLTVGLQQNNEHRGQVINTAVSYSGGPVLKSRPGGQLSCLRFWDFRFSLLRVTTRRVHLSLSPPHPSNPSVSFLCMTSFLTCCYHLHLGHLLWHFAFTFIFKTCFEILSSVVTQICPYHLILFICQLFNFRFCPTFPLLIISVWFILLYFFKISSVLSLFYWHLLSSMVQYINGKY
jgi:hypothetical protein